MHHSRNQPRKSGRFAKSERDPTDIELPEIDPVEEIGVGGTQVYGGYIQEDESDSRLKGIAKYKTYSDILANVSICAAGVRLLLNLVANADWKVEPADESEAAQKVADDVTDILNGMKTPWHRVIRRLAAYRFYGYACSEWTMRRDGGMIVLDDVKPRPQITIERWVLDEHSAVKGIIQTDPQTGKQVPIPREKLIYVVDDALSDSPEGLGLFRHVVDSAARLRRLQQLEGFGYEGDLRGIPIGRAPLAELDSMVKAKKITKSKAQALVKGLEDFISSHIKNPALGIMLDSTPYKGTGESRTPTQTRQWELELLDGGSYSLDAVAGAISRINREIARVLGVEHLLLGENGAGSRSLSNDKTASFGLIVDGTLKELREQVDADLLGPLWELNGWDPALRPTLKTDTQVFRNASELSAVIRDLATSGVQVDRQDEAVQEIFDLLGLSRLDDIDPDLMIPNEGE